MSFHIQKGFQFQPLWFLYHMPQWKLGKIYIFFLLYKFGPMIYCDMLYMLDFLTLNAYLQYMIFLHNNRLFSLSLSIHVGITNIYRKLACFYRPLLSTSFTLFICRFSNKKINIEFIKIRIKRVYKD